MGKHWNKSQQYLIDLADEPIRGVQLDVIYLRHEGSQLQEVIQHIAARPARLDAARQVRINADDPWDAVVAIGHIAGAKQYVGSGFRDTGWRCLGALARACQKPIILWLENMGPMHPVDRERLFFMLKHVALDLNISLRMVMLCGKASVKFGRKDEVTGKYMKRRTETRRSERLEEHGRVYEYTRDGLSEVETPLLDEREAVAV